MIDRDADGRTWVFAAGVTAGIDGALRLAAELRGDEAAQAIQLGMQYAPEPPFDSGTPRDRPGRDPGAGAVGRAEITARREATARAIAAELGIAWPPAGAGSRTLGRSGTTPEPGDKPVIGPIWSV